MKECLQPNSEKSIVIPENIPSEKTIQHWVTWRSEERAGTKTAKTQTYNPRAPNQAIVQILNIFNQPRPKTYNLSYVKHHPN